MDFISNNNLKLCESGWKFLKYEKDDMFVQHVDTVGAYTILLFPSNKINKNLIGGELIIDNITYNPNTFDNAKIIIFPTTTKHEVKKIISGVRYVFKTSASFNQNNHNNFENYNTSLRTAPPAINNASPIADVGPYHLNSQNDISDVGCDYGSYDMFGENNSDY